MDIKISFKKLICLALTVLLFVALARALLQWLRGGDTGQDEEEWRKVIFNSSEQRDLCIGGGNRSLRRLLLRITKSCVITGIDLVLGYQDGHPRWVCPSFPIK